MLLEYILARYMRRFTGRLKPVASASAEKPAMAPSSPEAANFPEMLYLHIPFCLELCPFCTFYRIPFEEETARRYFAALRTQLHSYKTRGYGFSTVYFGGGTPTVLPDELERLIAELRDLWRIEEISVETNPSDLTDKNIEMLKRSGVNRLSVGVQSFQDNLLESVNRIRKYGNSGEIRERLSEIQGKFDTLNVDLIFGLDGQTRADVAADLEVIKKLEIDQVTCYPLMKSGGEILGYKKWKQKMAWERDTYQMIRETLTTDYDPASAWCFSRRKGMIDEYIVEHSSYAGAGSGAFGLENDSMMINIFSVPSYISTSEGGNDTAVFRHNFKPGESLRYRLLMQLFRGYLDTDDLRRKGNIIEGITAKFAALILVIFGIVKKMSGKLLVTKRGAYLSVLLMKLFFEGVGELRGRCINAHSENPSQFHP